ncbi:hypothetical protein NC651_034231 [Populus alba x Populus x berolinensis]|nr:hypothetical protein NC651_034231 [Populus alba x Populus x berolinensis]
MILLNKISIAQALDFYAQALAFHGSRSRFSCSCSRFVSATIFLSSFNSLKIATLL